MPSKAKRILQITALALIAIPGVLGALSTAFASVAPSVQAPSTSSTQPDDLRALDGEWIFVEDRTEGRTLEQLNPPMSSKFSLRVEDGGRAIILNGHGSGHRDVRVSLDGSDTEVQDQNAVARYHGAWKDGAFEYDVEFEREPGKSGIGLIRRNFRITDEGLLVGVTVDPPAEMSVGLYRHAQDIPLPTPAKVAIGDMAWLAGTWLGTRNSGSSIEEHWIPPHGGAMLAVSRTVNTKGRMSTFEYLRIVERDGGLVYVAQPAGAKGTEFVLTELTTETGSTRAVFENPHHDFPRRIVYELSPEGRLSASIGQLKGGTPVRFEFKREE